jgi:hypothetical protein
LAALEARADRREAQPIDRRIRRDEERRAVFTPGHIAYVVREIEPAQ